MPVVLARTARAAPRPAAAAAAAAVEFRDVSLAFDEHVVLDHLSFVLPRGSMRVLLGASGAGKSVILKTVLGLMRPDAGEVFVDGRRIDDLPEHDLLDVRGNIGMVFQENALFDSLTVGENVGFRLADALRWPPRQVRARVEEVLAFVGLAEYVDRLPSTLSGGQRRRVAIARAIAPRPGLLLLDDPTTGLDPIIAASVDDEIVKLRDRQHVSCLIVTHQIRDAFYIATHRALEGDGRTRIAPIPLPESTTRFLVLGDGAIRFEGSGTELLASPDPFLKKFLYRTRPPW